jgi:branched-subunit amino acid aminotransferase/4-amino-4-deoxychorismate lyase
MATTHTSASWLWSGSEFAPCETVPISDRGFRYGMSVFESLRIRNRKPLFLREHCSRLKAALAETGFQVVLPSAKEIGSLLSTIPFEGFARLYVTAGDGEPSAPGDRGRMYLFVEPRARVKKRSYRLAISPTPHAPPFAGLKTGNYWANVAAWQRARAAGSDEALLFNPEGALVSACMANVFLIRDGGLLTPPTGDGARSGVIRDWVMRQWAVREVRITRHDLASTNEIFLTNSWIGVMPVSSLEGSPLRGSGIAGQLRVEYETEISEVGGGG